MLETVLKYWPIFTSGVVFLMWLMRLEGKALDNSRRILRLESQHEIIEQMALDIREMKTDIQWIKKNQS